MRMRKSKYTTKELPLRLVHCRGIGNPRAHHQDSAGLPALPDYTYQSLFLRQGCRVVWVRYRGETDIYPRLNTLYARRTAAGTTA